MMKAKEKMNRTVKTVDTACIQTVVAKREAAVITSLDTFYTSVKTALQTRKDALNAAWGQTDVATREQAIKAAHQAFQGTWKKANQALKTSRKDAWKVFKTDAKACKVTTNAESSAEQSDGQM